MRKGAADNCRHAQLREERIRSEASVAELQKSTTFVQGLDNTNQEEIRLAVASADLSGTGNYLNIKTMHFIHTDSSSRADERRNVRKLFV